MLVQAGSSDDGKTLAASVAEVIFTIQRDLAGAQAFYKDIKTRAVAHGRNPQHALVMPGVMPIIGRTRQEAQDRYEQLQALIHPDAGLNALSRTLGVDMSGADVDGPLPDVDVSKLQSRAVGIVETARREHMTVREVYEKLVVSKGHRQLIGTAVDVANDLQEWFEEGGGRRVQCHAGADARRPQRFRRIRDTRAATPRPFQKGLRRDDASAAPRSAEPGLGPCLASRKRKGRRRRLEYL